MEIYFKDRGRSFPAPERPRYPYLLLQRDGWNDYSYYTLYVAFVQRAEGPQARVELGAVRIMRKGQGKGAPTFSEKTYGPIDSSELVGTYCSLSSQEGYYEALQSLDDPELAKAILTALQDASFLPGVRKAFQDDDCFKVALLRDSSARRLLDEAGQAFGAVSDAIVEFVATIELDGASEPHVLRFDFGADASPLFRRVHALVGLNGVGKTQVLARLAVLLSRFSRQAELEKRSVLEGLDRIDPVPSIHSVVAISFSAFDDFERPTELQGEKFSYSYCGLRTQKGRLRSEEELLADVKDLISNRMDDARRDVLVKVLSSLVRVDDLHSFVFDVKGHEAIYGRLSAGQRIVLNSLCHLLSKISPRTLVLFDEPELHLHPQLLTSMMFALADVLRKYQSFAIVATHSPIVIQELPRTCVHVVRRERMKPIVYHPSFETFGENVSEITRNVFAATDSDRDYRTVLQDLLNQSNNDVQRVVELFDGRLGLNARIFLESLADGQGQER